MPTTRAHGESATRRRRALLEATAALAAEEGAGAVTHRAVAKRAGVPLSTTSYFFASINELVAEALRTLAGEGADAIELLATALPDDTTPTELVDVVVRYLTEGPAWEGIALIEAYLAAARDPDLRLAVSDAVAGYERAVVTALRVVGVPQPRRLAPIVHALLVGFTVHHVANPRDDDAERLRTALLALLDAYSGEPRA